MTARKVRASIGAQVAYIPDEWVQNKRKIPPSARDILFYYCSRADQDSGTTNVSADRTSQDLGMRKDHVDEHDRKLVKEGLISIEKTIEGRVVTLKDAWQVRSTRNGAKSPQVKANKATSQVLVKTPQNLGESPQNLGDLPKTWENPPKTWVKTPQNLGEHIRNNQLMEPAQGTRVPGEALVSSLEEIYPGHAASFRTIRELAEIAVKVQATPADVRRFPTWLKESYPKKANTPWAFKDLFPEFTRTLTPVNRNGFTSRFCPSCGGAKQCPRIVNGEIAGFDTCPECNGTGKPKSGQTAAR